MNRRLLSLAVAALLGAPAFLVAEDPKPATGADAPRGRFNPEERVKTMTAKLDLTPEQQAKFKEVFERNLPARKKIFEDAALAPEDQQKQSKALLKAEMDELNPVLTPEQREKWKKATTKPAPAAAPEAKPGVPKKSEKKREKKDETKPAEEKAADEKPEAK